MMNNVLLNFIEHMKKWGGGQLDIRPPSLKIGGTCPPPCPQGLTPLLIHQLLPFVFGELRSEGKCSSCGIVVSPLNAIMEDQICKPSPDYNAVILRQHCPDAGLIGTTNAKIDACKLLFGHAECFVDDTVKDIRFKGRVRAVVVDEAHFVIQW